MAVTLQDRINDLLVNDVANTIGTFTIHDSYATCYRGVGKKKVTEHQLEVLKQNWGKIDYSGNISNNTKRSIRTMLTGWSRAIEVYNRSHGLTNSKDGRRIVFVTLTLPSKQAHHDNEIKRVCLGAFIKNILRFSGAKYYFWRAESQKNGNIHFHLLFDCYIHKSVINYYWDSALSLLGYKTDIGEYHLNYSSTTTKIEAPRSNNSVSIYVVKYCLKNDSSRKIEGRVWGCSDKLREISRFTIDLSNDLFDILLQADKKKKITIIPSRYCDVYVGNVYGLLHSNSDYFRHESDCFYYITYLELYI